METQDLPLEDVATNEDSGQNTNEEVFAGAALGECYKDRRKLVDMV